MKFAIIVSKKDKAGLNIKENLLKLKPDLKIHTVEKESIFCENIDKEIDADFFIFATKHESESKIPSLSCHTPGNWSKAEFGGQDRKLCIAPASYLKMAFLELNKLGKNLGYDIVNEVAHHGPYLEKPVMFVEIGSSLEQWQDKKAGEIIAKTIINILSKKPGKYEIAFGIGGLHTCPIFNKIILRTNIALGQICPKYQLKNLDEEMILQAIKKTQEKVDFVLLDWKGLGKEKARIVKMLENLNLHYKRTDQILK